MPDPVLAGFFYASMIIICLGGIYANLIRPPYQPPERRSSDR